MNNIDTLLKKYPLVSDQINIAELRVILRELDRVLQDGIPGAVTEFGCYAGTAALFIQRVLMEYGGREFHVYDSFEGLPQKTREDSSPAGEQFQLGELKADKQWLIRNFRQANLPLPHIHKGWFSDMGYADIPDTIAFAFLDGDFYDSIIDSLTLVWPRLADGAIVVIDDYHTESLPGVRKAVEYWRKQHPLTARVESSLAIVRPAK